MPHDVFISYSSIDKSIADAACAVLEQNQVRCWIAPRDVVPGREYAGEIVEAIENSRLLVLILSNHSNSSSQVLREIERAVSKGLPILPFRIEEVQLSKNLEYFLSAPHWLDAITPPLERHLEHLSGTVQMLLDRQTTLDPRPVVRAAPRPMISTERPGWSLPWIGGVSLLAIGLTFGIWWGVFRKPAVDPIDPNPPTVNGPQSPGESPAISQNPAAIQPEANPAEPPPVVLHGQVLEGAHLVDHDYAFEITRPNDNWQFLLQEEVAQQNPNACLGMINPKHQGLFMVLVEEVPGTSLYDYLHGQVQVLNLTEVTSSEPQTLQLAGRTAMQIKASGKVDGQIHTSYLLTVVKRDNWFYQLVGFTAGPSLTKVEADILELCQRFTLRDSEPRFRAHQTPAADQYGIDWRIRGNEYQNLSFQFQVQLAEGWRFGSITEQQMLAVDSEVALYHQELSLTQVYFAEVIRAGSPEAAWAGNEERFARLINMESVQPGESIRIGDWEGRLFQYRDVETGMGKSDFALLQLADAQGEMCLQVRTTWPSNRRLVAEEKLRESLGFLRALTRHEMALLRQELVNHDPDNSVGTDFSLRAGLYQDFQYGFTFRRPKEGPWRLKAGLEAQALNPLARLVATCPSQGISLLVIPERITDEFSDEDYHEFLLARMAPGTIASDLNIGNQKFKVSEFDIAIEGIPLRYCLTTTRVKDRFIQVLFTGVQSMMQGVRDKLPEILGGLTLPQSELVPHLLTSERYLDFRLGFSLTNSTLGGELEIEALPYGLGTFASGVSLTNSQGACLVLACCNRDFNDKYLVQTMLETSGTSGFNLQDTRETDDSLAGLPAKRVDSFGRRAGRDVAVTICVIHRGATVYALAVFRESSGSQTEDERVLLRDYFEAFDLLPDGRIGLPPDDSDP